MDERLELVGGVDVRLFFDLFLRRKCEGFVLYILGLVFAACLVMSG